jgi:membrane-bound metal-dependent hydrolase YbcI (DUF457 family)
MMFEHWIYSTALAILVYTIYRKKECIYIIIGSAYVPDIDYIADKILKKIGITVLVYGQHIKHGDFHNILILLIYAILIALILNTINIKMKDSFILASIGFGAHLLEDALVFSIGYRFFWPISDKIYGIGILGYDYNSNKDLFGIANSEVLAIGITLVILSLCIKYIFDNNIIWKVVINGRERL